MSICRAHYTQACMSPNLHAQLTPVSNFAPRAAYPSRVATCSRFSNRDPAPLDHGCYLGTPYSYMAICLSPCHHSRSHLFHHNDQPSILQRDSMLASGGNHRDSGLCSGGFLSTITITHEGNNHPTLTTCDNI